MTVTKTQTFSYQRNTTPGRRKPTWQTVTTGYTEAEVNARRKHKLRVAPGSLEGYTFRFIPENA